MTSTKAKALHDEWRPEGRLTKADMEDVPVLVLYADGTWCSGTFSACYLRRPVPYPVFEQGTVRIVRAVVFDLGWWRACWGDYPACASWRARRKTPRPPHELLEKLRIRDMLKTETAPMISNTEAAPENLNLDPRSQRGHLGKEVGLHQTTSMVSVVTLFPKVQLRNEGSVQEGLGPCVHSPLPKPAASPPMQSPRSLPPCGSTIPHPASRSRFPPSRRPLASANPTSCAARSPKPWSSMRAARDKRSFAMAVPTHKLGDEAVARFEDLEVARRLGLTAAVWRGRDAMDPEEPTQKMCLNEPAVSDAAALGLDIQGTACRRVVKGVVHECPFFNQCGYQRQRQQQADVWFVPHDLLFTEKPTAIGDLAALVIDELFMNAGLGGISGKPLTISIDSLYEFSPGAGVVSPDLARLRAKLQEVLQKRGKGPLSRKALLKAGITAQQAGEAVALEYERRIDPGILPDTIPTQRREKMAAAAQNRTINRMVTMWRAVRDLLSDGGPEFSGRVSIVDVETEPGKVRALQLRWRKEIRSKWQVPTLLIDALLKREVVREFFPEITINTVGRCTAPYQRIHQLTDRTYSKRYLNEELKNARDANVATRHMRDLHAIICRIANGTNGTMLTAAQKDIEEALAERGFIPSNVSLAHHNGVAGSDQYKNCTSMAIIGRTMPSPVDVEAIAGALTGAAVLPIDGWYPKVTVNRRMADGSIVPAEADRHPDPTAEAVRWLICEGELLQLIGRGRGINREASQRLDIYLLTKQPVPILVDRLFTSEELDPSPFDLQMAAGGIAFDSGTAAATAYPALWKSAGAARMAFSDWTANSSASFSHIESLMGDSCGALPAERAGWWSILCRKAKNGAHWFKVLGDPDVHPKPQAAVEAILGPIEWKWDDDQGRDEIEQEEFEREQEAADMAEVTVGPASLVCECGEEHFLALSSEERFAVHMLELRVRLAESQRQRAAIVAAMTAMVEDAERRRQERRNRAAEFDIWLAETDPTFDQDSARQTDPEARSAPIDFSRAFQVAPLPKVSHQLTHPQHVAFSRRPATTPPLISGERLAECH